MDPWFVTGLIEGAGSFTYSRQPGSALTLYFSIKLPQADGALLEDLRDFFGGIGRIYDSGPGARYYRVTRHNELTAVLDHFDRYPLRGRKRAAYAIWRQMVHLKIQHHRKRPAEQLEQLARELSELTGPSS